MTSLPSEGRFHSLSQWLNRLRRRGKLLAMSAGGMWSIAVAAALLLVVPVLEAIFRFSSTGRWILAISSVVIAGLVIFLGILRHGISLLLFKRYPRDEALASKVGQRVPSILDRLLNALQLGKLLRDNREGYSHDLALEAVDRVARDLEFVDLRSVERNVGIKRAAKIMIGAVLVTAVAYIAGSGTLSASLHRVSNPSKDFPRPLPFQLLVTPGDTKALKGDTVQVKIAVQGRMPAKIRLFTQADSRKEADDYNLLADRDSVFRFALGPVRESMKYWAESGPVAAGPYRLTVRERPFIRNLQAKVIPPAYSKLPVTFSEANVGDITALKGSKVELFVETNMDLAEGWMEIEAADDSLARQNLDVLGNRLHGSFTVMDDFEYRIRMADPEGITDRDPIWYRVTGLLDRDPSVRIIQPPGDVEITEQMLLPLLVEAEDDFGISRMALRYHRASIADPEDLSLDDYDSRTLAYKVDDDGLTRCDELWDLSPMDLLPEDEVSFYVEVWDNDQVTGPKSARSDVLKVRFPSLDDLYAQTEDQQDNMGSDLSETLKAAQELSQAMQEITDEWKRNPEMTWEEQQRLQDVMKRQEELAKTVDDIAQQMKEMAQSIQENSLFTEETLQKYMELQDLFQRVATPELKEAMRKLAEAMQKQNPEELLKAMENFQLTQEQFQKQLDRSLNILKQMELEMKMDELAKRADDLLKRQEAVNNKLDSTSDSQSMKDLASQEDKMSSDMESLEKEFQKAQDMAKDLMKQTPQEMQDIDQFLQQEQLPSQMQTMSSMMSQSSGSCKKRGQKISNSLNQLSQMMQQAKQNIVQKKMDQLLAALERETANLLRLSFNQEDLMDSAEDLPVSSPQFDALAERQQDVRSGLQRVADSVYAIARETFFISPQLGAAMGQAMQKMDEGIDASNQRDGRKLSQQGHAAMGALNKAALLMQQSADQMSKSCSSTGGEEMMKKMSELSCQQEGLNQNTMSLFQGNEGQYSMEQLSEMKRLAAQQAQIQQQLGNLAQNAKETQETLGRLDEVGKQMGEVVNDLKDMNLNERTLQRQEKILTRLLDAQRSVREREYSPKRQSKTGEDIVRMSPRMQNPHTDAESLRQDLLKALEGHYVRDYEQLIRQYFDALARERVSDEK
jgi:hypothetical protein